MTVPSGVIISGGQATDADQIPVVRVDGGLSGAGALPVDAAAGRTIKFASISVASSGDNSIVAAVSAKKITVLGYVIVADAAVTMRWYSGAGGTALSGAMSLATNGGISAHMSGIPLMQAGTNTALVLNLGGAVGARGHLVYYEA